MCPLDFSVELGVSFIYHTEVAQASALPVSNTVMKGFLDCSVGNLKGCISKFSEHCMRNGL